MPRKARITPSQLKTLQEMGLKLEERPRKRRNAPQGAITSRMVWESLGPALEAPGAESEAGFTGDWPGAATHHLAKAIACPICGQDTKTMVQVLDGLKIGDPMCNICYVSTLPKSWKRGKAYEAMNE